MGHLHRQATGSPVPSNPPIAEFSKAKRQLDEMKGRKPPGVDTAKVFDPMGVEMPAFGNEGPEDI